MKIIIAGSSGFIGRHLISHWSDKTTTYWENGKHQLVLLTRNPVRPDSHYWNPEKGQIDPTLLEGADLVINLSGENIVGRWSEKKKEQIRESRYIASQFLCQSILALKNPPKLYIGASAVGYYGDRGEEILTENSPAGKGFLAEVCSYWERIPQILTSRGIRVVFTRFGVVLGEGGALQLIVKAFRTGMGGILGTGKQLMSWIAIDDLCSAMDHLISHPELKGPINFTSPHAVTNQELTDKLGKQLNRPTLLPVPKFALTLLMGEGADMFLASVHAKPQKLLDSGFKFQYPFIDEPLTKYLHTGEHR